jgi:hypothetical protein
VQSGFGNSCCLHHQELIALMIEAASTSETSVNFYQTTRRSNPEDSHLHADFDGNSYLRSNVYVFIILRTGYQKVVWVYFETGTGYVLSFILCILNRSMTVASGVFFIVLDDVKNPFFHYA